MPGEPDKPDWCKNDPPISYFSVQSMVWPADGEQSTKGIDILIYSSIGQLPYVISSAPTLGKADLDGSASAAACMETQGWHSYGYLLLSFSNLTPAEAEAEAEAEAAILNKLGAKLNLEGLLCAL